MMKNITEQNIYEYAGFWIRFGASVIGIVLFLMLTMPIMFMVYGTEQMLYSEKIMLGTVDFMLNILLPLVTTVILWKFKSATPSKMILKLKVVDAITTNQLTMKQSVIRYFAYLVAIIPFGIGMFWVAWDKKKQGWHDKLAKTMVIKNKK